MAVSCFLGIWFLDFYESRSSSSSPFFLSAVLGKRSDKGELSMSRAGLLFGYFLVKVLALLCYADGEPGQQLEGFVMVSASNDSREAEGGLPEPPHTEDRCRGYYDVMGQWDPAFVCRTASYLYCCGTCGFRFCCAYKSSRLDQSKCQNYDTPMWMMTGRTPSKKNDRNHDPTRDKTNLIVYIVCGVVAIMALVGIFTKLGLEKAHRPHRENMTRALASVMQQQGPGSRDQMEREVTMGTQGQHYENMQAQARATANSLQGPQMNNTGASMGPTPSLVPTMGQTMGQNMNQNINQSMNQTMGQTMAHSMGQNMSNTMGHTMGQNMPHTMGQNMGQNMHHGMGQSISHSMGHTMGHNMGQNMGHVMSQNMAHPMGQNMGQNMPHSMGQNMGQNMPHSMGQNIGQNMGQNVSHSMGQTMGHNMGQNMGQNVSHSMGHTMGHVSHTMGQNMSHSMGHAIGQNMPHSMGQNMPHSMGQSTSHTMGQNTSHSMGHNASHSMGHNAAHSMGHNTSHSMAHNASHSMAHNASHSMAHNASHSMAHNASHAMAHNASHAMAHNASHSMAHNASHSIAHNASHSMAHSTSHSMGQNTSHSMGQNISHSMSHTLGHTTGQKMTQSLVHTLPQPSARTLPQPMAHTLPQPIATPIATPITHTYHTLDQLSHNYDHHQSAKDLSSKYASLKAVAEKASESYFSNRRQMVDFAVKGSLPLHPVRLDHGSSGGGVAPYGSEMTCSSGGSKQSSHRSKSSGRGHGTHPLAYASHTIASPSVLKGWGGSETLGRRHNYGAKRLYGLEQNQLRASQSQHFLSSQPYFITNSKTEVTV